MPVRCAMRGCWKPMPCCGSSLRSSAAKAAIGPLPWFGDKETTVSTATSHYPAAPTSEGIETRTLCVLVDNEPGVLARVIGLFAGRGYNIDSLTVSATEHEKHLSRIT